MNSPLPILVLPIGTPPDSVAEARACGYLPILCDDAAKVRVLHREESSDRHAMLMAAMHGIQMPGSDSNKARFFNELHRSITATES